MPLSVEGFVQNRMKGQKGQSGWQQCDYPAMRRAKTTSAVRARGGDKAVLHVGEPVRVASVGAH